ncbi:beta-ketoacyl reductase, partial [Herpetosiphon giganteus]|uniref:beta-ketoacyl reductase n=1 Tax=Herpetosiphon giganteus TaxID=2029754 RepID=UPI00195E2BB9
ANPATVVVPSLARDHRLIASLARAAGQLWAHGVAIDWSALIPPTTTPYPLPAYPWQRKRHWLPTHSSMQRAKQPTQSAQDFYVVRWEQVSSDSHDLHAQSSGPWLMISDQAMLATELAESIQAEDCEVVLHASLAGDDAAIEALLKQRTWHGIIYYPCLSTTDESCDRQQAQICGDVLCLISALARSESANKPKLWLITTLAQPADGAVLNPQHATLWGLSRSIGQEHPQHWGGIIDLDQQPSAFKQIATIITTQQQPLEVAWRAQQQYRPTLIQESIQLQQPNPSSIQPHATYLITGGLGGLGLACANWLAEIGARSIALIGRKQPNQQTQQQLEQLQTKGINVQFLQADVSVKESVEQVVQQIQASTFPLGGVIHTAGVVDDGLIINQTWENYERVFAPKVLGTWNLHHATKHLKLDWFVLFSSGISLTGAAGQANYAAANAFLDAMAYYRQSQGLPAVSINWGAWAEIGMAARLGTTTTQRLAASGMQALTPAQGIAALATILQTKHAQIGVFQINWAEFAKASSSRSKAPLLKALLQTGSAEATSNQSASRRYLLGLAAYQRTEQFELFIDAQLRKSLRLDDQQPIDPHQGLFTLGFDSLTSLELTNRLSVELGLALPPTLTFDYGTPKILTNYLFERLFGSSATPETPEASPESERKVAIQELSEADLIALLDTEIALLQQTDLERNDHHEFD